MKLIFENSRKEQRVLGERKTYQGCNKLMMGFLSQHNYKSYYQRVWWETDHLIKIDVGSWYEFFYIEVADDEMNKLPERILNIKPNKENKND